MPSSFSPANARHDVAAASTHARTFSGDCDWEAFRVALGCELAQGIRSRTWARLFVRCSAGLCAFALLPLLFRLSSRHLFAPSATEWLRYWTVFAMVATVSCGAYWGDLRTRRGVDAVGWETMLLTPGGPGLILTARAAGALLQASLFAVAALPPGLLIWAMGGREPGDVLRLVVLAAPLTLAVVALTLGARIGLPGMGLRFVLGQALLAIAVVLFAVLAALYAPLQPLFLFPFHYGPIGAVLSVAGWYPRRWAISYAVTCLFSALAVGWLALRLRALHPRPVAGPPEPTSSVPADGNAGKPPPVREWDYPALVRAIPEFSTPRRRDGPNRGLASYPSLPGLLSENPEVLRCRVGEAWLRGTLQCISFAVQFAFIYLKPSKTNLFWGWGFAAFCLVILSWIGCRKVTEQINYERSSGRWTELALSRVSNRELLAWAAVQGLPIWLAIWTYGTIGLVHSLAVQPVSGPEATLWWAAALLITPPSTTLVMLPLSFRWTNSTFTEWDIAGTLVAAPVALAFGVWIGVLPQWFSAVSPISAIVHVAIAHRVHPADWASLGVAVVAGGVSAALVRARLRDWCLQLLEAAPG